MQGLRYTPNLGEENNGDSPSEWRLVPQEYSDRNHHILREALEGTKCQSILEIGVNRSGEKSSTQTLLKHRSPGCFYVGVDIMPKEYLGPLAWTIQCDSSEHEKVMSFLQEKTGHKRIDFLHIDGWHSVNQVLKDFAYVSWLSNGGCVVLHDAGVHPGPVELLKAIDNDFWDASIFFEDDPHDWGIAVLRRKGDEKCLTKI